MIFICLLTLIIFFTGIQIITYATEEKDILSVYKEVGFEVDKAYINTWAKLNIPQNTQYSVDKLCLMVADRVGLEEPFEFNYTNGNSSEGCTISKTAVDVTSSISVKRNKSEMAEYYIIMEFEVKNKLKSSYMLRDRANCILTDLGGEPITNLTVEGYSPGNIFEKNLEDNTVSGIDAYFGLKFVDKIQSDLLYNTYGYTRHIPEYIIFSGNKVNLDLSLTYDEEKNLSKLYVGTPVINVEY